MQKKIFICYRRTDADYVSSVLFDRLSKEFGADAIFWDFQSIPLGVDFAQLLRESVEKADVFLSVIGPQWQVGITNPHDWVRIETEIALKRNIPVIPILVGDVSFPRLTDLPPSLQALLHRQGIEIPTGPSFLPAIARLVESLRNFFITSSLELKSSSELSTLSRQGEVIASPTPYEKPPNVFISYRRDGGAETARLLRYELKDRDFRVFLDVEDLPAGQFDEYLLKAVADSNNLLLIVSKNAFEGCHSEEDWLRKEIRQAISFNKNIVPLVKEDATPPRVDALPADIKGIARLNCVKYSHDYYSGTIQKLLSFLGPSNRAAPHG